MSIRASRFAGSFYSADADELNVTVSAYLDQSKERVLPTLVRPIIGIVPHAGYIYSGQIAADLYYSLGKFTSDIKTIVVVGPSHNAEFSGFAVSDVDYFQTPLGDVALDGEKIENLLKKHKSLFVDNHFHENEHSIEVQLPFIQKTLPGAKLIPILVSENNPQALANVLINLMDDKTIILISSDLSHYLKYKDNKIVDAKTIAAIENLRLEDIQPDRACGYSGIQAAMNVASKVGLVCKNISFCNSGDVMPKGKDSVVGYASFLYIRSQDQLEDMQGFFNLKTDIINIVKASTLYGLEHNKCMLLEEFIVPKIGLKLHERYATFVTLKITGQLRGCIGSILPEETILENIIHNAFNAAFMDSRFSALTKKEFEHLEISVSILTRPAVLSFKNRADLISKIRQNVDGLILSYNDYRGVFLPSVWEEIDTKDEFLMALVEKAGLPRDYWTDDIRMKRFEVLALS